MWFCYYLSNGGSIQLEYMVPTAITVTLLYREGERVRDWKRENDWWRHWQHFETIESCRCFLCALREVRFGSNIWVDKWFSIIVLRFHFDSLFVCWLSLLFETLNVIYWEFNNRWFHWCWCCCCYDLRLPILFVYHSVLLS